MDDPSVFDELENHYRKVEIEVTCDLDAIVSCVEREQELSNEALRRLSSDFVAPFISASMGFVSAAFTAQLLAATRSWVLFAPLLCLAALSAGKSVEAFRVWKSAEREKMRRQLAVELRGHLQGIRDKAIKDNELVQKAYSLGGPCS